MRPPHRVNDHPEIGDMATMASPDGTIANPAAVTPKPNPAPVLTGC